ncbi:MAG: hypothetical protein Q9166_000918 [cf. Caloplaca sp. 2 TL-2023]
MFFKTLSSTLLFFTLLAFPSILSASPTPQFITGVDKTGKYKKSASDILVCPSQPLAINILCGGPDSSDRNGVMKKCVPLGSESIGCLCQNGQFICSNGAGGAIGGPWVAAEVPGGESAIDYFKDVGCNCDG